MGYKVQHVGCTVNFLWIKIGGSSASTWKAFVGDCNVSNIIRKAIKYRRKIEWIDSFAHDISRFKMVSKNLSFFN